MKIVLLVKIIVEDNAKHDLQNIEYMIENRNPTVYTWWPCWWVQSQWQTWILIVLVIISVIVITLTNYLTN